MKKIKKITFYVPTEAKLISTKTLIKDLWKDLVYF